MKKKTYPVPDNFKQEKRLEFEKLKNPELDFERFYVHEVEEFHRLNELEMNISRKYQPTMADMTPCGNGGFEEDIDQSQWQGAYGRLPLSVSNPFGNFTSGILSGPINSATSRQTWVGAGVDPHVGISTTAPNSAGSVRIGNSINGYGCELLSKTFVVTAQQSIITFWYALVLQNPIGHSLSKQPFFWIRVTDSGGNIIPGAFDFGNGSDKIIADANNPFFQSKKVGHDTLVYKDWSCVQIDLSSQVGKQVTIELVTADCGYGGHWGYAYVDSFCGSCEGSPTGSISYNCEASSHCGPGKLCIDYSLPLAPGEGSPTGTVKISLDVYQNGTLLTQLDSPVLTRGNSYCFDIDLEKVPGVNPGLGGLDFVVTGKFRLGKINLGQKKIGTKPNGIKPGQNNDYALRCKTCEEIQGEQEAYLSNQNKQKINYLSSIHCHCPNSKPIPQKQCHCSRVKWPEIEPCISIGWGDSKCDGLETDDVETLSISVCNCYSNLTFENVVIHQLKITDRYGNPVPVLPDGTPSLQVIPSGPICFGDIGPCQNENKPGCVSRELILYTRGAKEQEYMLSLSGICFSVTHHIQTQQCFMVEVCKD